MIRVILAKALAFHDGSIALKREEGGQETLRGYQLH
jgi:hypothetical protein